MVLKIKLEIKEHGSEIIGVNGNCLIHFSKLWCRRRELGCKLQPIEASRKTLILVNSEVNHEHQTKADYLSGEELNADVQGAKLKTYSEKKYYYI